MPIYKSGQLDGFQESYSAGSKAAAFKKSPTYGKVYCMADIRVDDTKLAEMLADSIKAMVAKEKSTVHSLAEGFLDEVANNKRLALKDISEALDSFKADARLSLADADAKLNDFERRLSEKKKKVEDALNTKVVGGFSALMMLALIVTAAALGDRVVAVKLSTTNLSTAAVALTKSSGELQTAINNANEVYKSVAKGTDPTSQLQTLTNLTNHVNDDLKKLTAQVQKMSEDMKPLQTDYLARHPGRK